MASLRIDGKEKMTAPIPQYQVPPPQPVAGNGGQNTRTIIVAALTFFVTLSVVLMGLWGYSAWNAKRVAERFDEEAAELAAQLQECVPEAFELAQRADRAQAIATDRRLDYLDSSIARSRGATDALNETVNILLDSSYFQVVEVKGSRASASSGSSSSSDSAAMVLNEVTVVYDSSSVPEAKKTSSTLEELQEGGAALMEQLQDANDAVEELEFEMQEYGILGEHEEDLGQYEEVTEEYGASNDSGCTAPVPGAYPCAGQGLPANAQPIQTVYDGGATAVTPSKNIGCDLYAASSWGNSWVMCGGWLVTVDGPQLRRKQWRTARRGSGGGLRPGHLRTEKRRPQLHRWEPWGARRSGDGVRECLLLGGLCLSLR